MIFMNLVKELNKSNISFDNLANSLNISLYSLNRRLKGEVQFKLSEVTIIMELFNTKKFSYLFETKVTNNEI